MGFQFYWGQELLRLQKQMLSQDLALFVRDPKKLYQEYPFRSSNPRHSDLKPKKPFSFEFLSYEIPDLYQYVRIL